MRVNHVALKLFQKVKCIRVVSDCRPCDATLALLLCGQSVSPMCHNPFDMGSFVVGFKNILEGSNLAEFEGVTTLLSSNPRGSCFHQKTAGSLCQQTLWAKSFMQIARHHYNNALALFIFLHCFFGRTRLSGRLIKFTG